MLESGAASLFSDTSCPACSAAIWVNDDGLVRTGILTKAWKELQSGHLDLAIIFSALAVECELGRVFTKWKNIESGLMTKRPSGFEENKWVWFLRSVGILQRLDRVCDFLIGQSFDVFLKSQSDLAKSVHERHPTSVSIESPRRFFDQHLFWKRDEIVHRGRIDFRSGSAEEAFKSTLTLFQIISEMDFSRRRKMAQTLSDPKFR